VQVDNADPASLQQWQRQLAELTGSTPSAPWQTPVFEPWTLQRRQLLNPGSAGAPVYLLDLHRAANNHWQAADAPGAPWQPGDLVQILPRNSHDRVARLVECLALPGSARVSVNGLLEPLPMALANRQLPDSIEHLIGLHAQALVEALVPISPREYSVASIASDGILQLLVRQEQHKDGRLGLASGWLTEQVALGSPISLRVQRNSGFHLPVEDVPVILLGNGTGLAGLRSLLKGRIAQGRQRNWLLFGERNAEHDFYCQAELQGWLASGMLARLDLAFSRDQGAKVYVQHRLREGAQQLRQWLAQGGYLYVCGSLTGMAQGVDQVLRELLGAEAVEALIEQGRYRRDVY
jgi:sulfite reductase (NADPH) flavoprotein alpha-component